MTQLGQISDELATTIDTTPATTSTTTTQGTTLATTSTTPATTRAKTSTTTTSTEATTLAIFFPGFFGGARTNTSEGLDKEPDKNVSNEKKGFIDEIRTLLFSNFVEEGGKVMKNVFDSFLGR